MSVTIGLRKKHNNARDIAQIEQLQTAASSEPRF
jgi:hypothetical protein